MNKLVMILTLLLVTACTKNSNSSGDKSSTENLKDGKKEIQETEHQDPDGYWTCSMHPQVHQHGPGECPICGMPLIKVKENKNAKKVESAGFEPSQEQLKNAHLSLYTVTKKDLPISLHVLGRLVSSKEIVFQVYESDLELIKTGFEFSGYLANDSKNKLSGKVISIDKIIDPSSRTIRVTGLLQNAPQQFIADIGFHGSIEKTLKNILVVPEEAVLHTGTHDLVYVFSKDQKIHAREVQLGAKSKTEYEITSGLDEGEVISSGANFLIDSESKIRGQ